MQNIDLNVTGMKCGGCEATVVQALSALNGVSSAIADHKNNKVTIAFDADKVTPAELREAITKHGYTVAAA